MPRARVQRIQDPVHGLMEFQGMEGVVLEILGTRELQRLRRVRQLGLAYLVFPGAEHSRLVHSLGAAHLAIRFAKQLAESSRDYLLPEGLPGPAAIRDIAVGALCHDLGHGPLSHAWEKEVVGPDFDFEKWCVALGVADGEKPFLKGAKWHEIVGYALLGWPDGQLHQLLEQHERGFSARLRQLLRGRYFLKYLPPLLRSEIDVDRADFLRRDAHQTGVAYGRYDLDWLISTATIGETHDGRYVFGFSKRKSIQVVEQFLIAHKALYETVYYHKTVHSAEGMIANFLRRLREITSSGAGGISVEGFLKPMIKVISGNAVGPEEILSLDDSTLWVLVDSVARLNNVDKVLADLAGRILTRHLFKVVPCKPEHVRDFLDRHDEPRNRILSKIQPYVPGNPVSYLVEDPVRVATAAENRDEYSYLVDVDSGARSAEPVRDHDPLKPYFAKAEVGKRLYTVSEAVEDVRKLIDKT